LPRSTSTSPPPTPSVRSTGREGDRMSWPTNVTRWVGEKNVTRWVEKKIAQNVVQPWFVSRRKVAQSGHPGWIPECSLMKGARFFKRVFVPTGFWMPSACTSA
jgi:hypothetical protein